MKTSVTLLINYVNSLVHTDVFGLLFYIPHINVISSITFIPYKITQLIFYKNSLNNQECYKEKCKVDI